ncbi:MAG: hypothetical protein LBV69_09730 [Bacteroidales bacterium]|jgi:hypothetical protein|nr:hypothetical protein [Bacteroidales bacterium]
MSDLRYKNKLFDVICFGVGQGLFTLVTYTDKNNKKSGFVFDCGGDKMYIEGDTSY